jgi:hypothetical protein
LFSSSRQILAPNENIIGERQLADASMTFGCINIRSILNKFDDVVDLCQSLDIVGIVESWHDMDSPVLGRLRAAGYFVADRPRPRVRDDDMTVNHGGIVIVGRYPMTVIAIEQSSTFELLFVQITAGKSSFFLAVIYRPGSEPVRQQFFEDFGSLLERLATYQASVYIAGDFNIHLERVDDSDTQNFQLLASCSGFDVAVLGETHSLGGTLDTVLSRSDMPTAVSIIDVGLSDHHLLRWAAVASIPPVVTAVVHTRPWKRLNMADLREAVCSSALYDSTQWPVDLDMMAELYDSTITSILDVILPVRCFRRIRRRSDPWFDDDCRLAKRLTRRLERRASTLHRHSAPDDVFCAARDDWYRQRRAYRALRQSKSDGYWRSVIEANSTNPSKLWHAVDNILGRTRVCSYGSIPAERFSQFFIDKVDRIRQATAGSSPPSFMSLHMAGVQLDAFEPVTVDEVIRAIGQLPNKMSAADPLSTDVLKNIADLVAPYISDLFNRSLNDGHVPLCFKRAFLTPIVKKPGLDPRQPSSYRPISNLSVISKLLERLVAKRLTDYLRRHELLPVLQSGFRAGHSTETATLRVLSDILSAIDRGDFGALVLLDLSAAFDTVDHEILLKRLETTYGFSDAALLWFQSYLTDRFQHVRCGADWSTSTRLTCGVPQGSVLGPILFIMYTADLCQLVLQHNFNPHLYADDTQIYNSCHPSDVDDFVGRLSACVDDVFEWLKSNRLQPNPDKTEMLWCSTSRRAHQLPTSAIAFGGVHVLPTRSVRNLGVYFDATLAMREHVSRTVSRCFAALRQLRTIRSQVPASVFKSLVLALVLSRLDYGNAALSGVSSDLLRRLQMVQNAAARLIFGFKRREHVTDALLELHWLKVRERIDFKLLTLTYRSLHGAGPCYLDVFRRVADQPGRHVLRSAASDRLLIPAYKLVSAGARAFSIAGATAWNTLPSNVTSAPSLPIFKSRLKTFLFRRSFPDCLF